MIDMSTVGLPTQKKYSDNTLKTWNKDELIRYIRILEGNYDAAMGREEKVCKQVDEECRDCREPYEDSLVSVCREITRKVKGALWTI